MSSVQCLNCGHILTGRFCSECGQKASVHRFSFLHFVKHDLVHGVFHIEKGILFTLREIIVRPGYAVKEYIAGKRVNYFNIFTLMFLILVLRHFFREQVIEGAPLFQSYSNDKNNIHLAEISNHIVSYYKYLFIATIPLVSLWSRIFFKRLNYNFSEHMIANSFFFTGCAFYSLIINIIEWTAAVNIVIVPWVLYIVYMFWSYSQLNSGLYSIGGFVWRGVSTIIFFIITFIVVVLGILMIIYQDVDIDTIQLLG